MQNETQKLVHAMLMENTGIAMMDSGGDDGRAWQRNAKHDPASKPAVSLEIPERPCQSDNVEITVSLYHYLPTVLELDEVCDKYNALKQADWDGEAYGVSKANASWLKRHGFSFGQSWNTYNGECNLSQTLQGTEVKRDGVGEGDYVLLQVHGGADVRGGYTDAKLFKYQRFQEYINPTPCVWAQVKRGNEVIPLQMRESGYGFVLETDDGNGGEPIEILDGDEVECGLYE